MVELLQLVLGRVERVRKKCYRDIHVIRLVFPDKAHALKTESSLRRMIQMGGVGLPPLVLMCCLPRGTPYGSVYPQISEDRSQKGWSRGSAAVSISRLIGSP